MLIALILAALLATDIAVAVLYFSTRPGRTARARTPSASASEAVTRELEELVVTLRRQAEQATAEIGRQKAQLRRLLAGMGEAEPQAAGLAAQPSAVRPARLPSLSDDDLTETLPLSRQPAAETAVRAARATPGQIRRLASEGLPPRAIAGRTRLSVEEVRLMLAMSEVAMSELTMSEERRTA